MLWLDSWVVALYGVLHLEVPDLTGPSFMNLKPIVLDVYGQASTA